jgi:hypothetical protein
MQDCFLPDKYILPSTSSEESFDDPEAATSPLLARKDSCMPAEDQALLAFTPVKDSSNRLNQSNLTPATWLQALSLDDSPSSDATRDSVFFAPKASSMDNEQAAKENLMCFSPLAE